MNRKAPHFRTFRNAFSLMELIIAITIIAVLGTLSFSAFQSSIRKARETQCIANLRQIGVGLAGYTAEHNNRLPGPLQASQGPRYNKVNGEVAAYLASFLAPYIGIPEAASGPLPTLENAIARAPMFYCPSFGAAADPSFANAYLVRWRIPEMGTNMPPWGNYGTTIPQRPKSVMQIPNRATVWAVTDLDQMCPDLPPESWVSRAPARPVHGSRRNALFFDWHVGKITPTGEPL